MVISFREPNLFQRGGTLVQVVAADAGGGAAPAPRCPGRSPEAPAARQVQEPRMRELIASHCLCLKQHRVKGVVEWRPAHPPAWLPRSVLHRIGWPLRRLEGLVEGPVLRADGSVLQTAGYDPASGLYLASATRFEPVPENPTGGQREAALERLRQAVDDFGRRRFSVQPDSKI